MNARRANNGTLRSALATAGGVVAVALVACRRDPPPDRCAQIRDEYAQVWGASRACSSDDECHVHATVPMAREEGRMGARALPADMASSSTRTGAARLDELAQRYELAHCGGAGRSVRVNGREMDPACNQGTCGLRSRGGY